MEYTIFRVAPCWVLLLKPAGKLGKTHPGNAALKP